MFPLALVLYVLFRIFPHTMDLCVATHYDCHNSNDLHFSGYHELYVGIRDFGIICFSRDPRFNLERGYRYFED